MHAGSLWKRGGELFWRKSPEHFTNMADREDLARRLYIAVKKAITEAVAFQQLPSPEEQVKSRYSCTRYAELEYMPSRSYDFAQETRLRCKITHCKTLCDVNLLSPCNHATFYGQFINVLTVSSTRLTLEMLC